MVELTLVELLGSAAVSVKAVTVLNKMNRASHRWLARAWILLEAGQLAPLRRSTGVQRRLRGCGGTPARGRGEPSPARPWQLLDQLSC